MAEKPPKDERPLKSIFGAARQTVSDWRRRRRGEEPKPRPPVEPGKLEEWGIAKEDPGGRIRRRKEK